MPLFDAPKSSELPALSLLDEPRPREQSYSDEALEAMSRLVELKLKDFGVEAEVVAVQPGPVITRFELRPAPGVKVSQISNLAKDLARALSAISVRVVEIIPGKSVVGLEIPNEKREIVTLGEIIKSKAYDDVGSPLALALGKDIGGVPVVADLARMPHLLIAGTTGSGKSVGINAMVLSLVYKATPEHVRMIMIDPKMLELSVYEGHPASARAGGHRHEAGGERAALVRGGDGAALPAHVRARRAQHRRLQPQSEGCRGEPASRSRTRSACKRSRRACRASWPRTSRISPRLPFVVVIIDELADLMMIVGKKVEELIARLAQKARASGIHLILATQRPSVDVITGLIKANIPTRIAFQVSAKVDSRTILDQSGAESLLGHGDMLYLPPGTSIPTRVHGAFVSDQEVHRVVAGLKSAAAPTYIERSSRARACRSRASRPMTRRRRGRLAMDAEADPLYDEAVRDRHRDAQGIDFRRAAPAEDRLQPRGAAGRGDGGGGARGSAAVERRA